MINFGGAKTLGAYSTPAQEVEPVQFDLFRGVVLVYFLPFSSRPGPIWAIFGGFREVSRAQNCFEA